MQKNKKLMELVEQAASTATMLSPDDTAEADQLKDVFKQINKSLSRVKTGPADILEQTRQTSSGIAAILSQMSAENADNAEALIDSVTQEVMSLQTLIDQLYNPRPVEACPPPAPAETDCVTETAPAEQAAAPSASVQTPPATGTMIDEDDIPLVQDFIAESNEHIESAEAGLLELESKPDDSDVMNLIFRGFHTIKGMAGFLNLTDIGSLAHSTENLLDMARKGELVLTGENTDVVFASIDLLKTMIAELQQAMAGHRPVATPLALPALLERIEACSQSQPPRGGVTAPAAGADSAPSTPAAATAAEPIADSAPEPQTPLEAAAGPDATAAARKNDANAPDEKIKVSTTRLDKLVNMAGELVIAQLMVSEEACGNFGQHHDLNRKVAHQGKIVRELQELSMSMRMVQIAGVFQKMNRLVRDVSRKAGKTIDFITFGEETELDRNIVDKIADPLVHMLRNSVDHGVEAPDARRQAGKDPVGRIELRAFHEAGNIVIEIEDDGKGLDKNRILAKAVQNGVVEPEAQLTDDQIYKLIFHAGLSTAEQITSVSGRGVGMDVVKKNIESLRGRVDITSTPGRGTIFTIRLPLTLAMIDGQVVKVGQNRYIVPINSIIGTLRPQPEQISTVQNRLEVVLVRGELLPLIRLYDLFHLEPATTNPADALLVIVEDDGKKCCMLVDDLLAQQRVVIKSLGEGLGKVQGVSGGAIMGDGKVSLILDIPSLMKLAQADDA